MATKYPPLKYPAPLIVCVKINGNKNNLSSIEIFFERVKNIK